MADVVLVWLLSFLFIYLFIYKHLEYKLDVLNQMILCEDQFLNYDMVYTFIVW